MNYGERPEALDARWIFRAYAIVAGAAGLLLMGLGPMWLGTDFGGEKWAKAALIRVFGAIIAGAACCAEAFAREDDPESRHRALKWFAAAHGIVALVLISQESTIWGPGIGEKTTEVVTAMTLMLLYFFSTQSGETMPRPLTTLFGGGDRAASTAELRSTYELKIREAARQEERNRLARDLHDSIKQQIFVVQTAAATAQTRFETDPAGTRAALDMVRSAAREASAEMQAMLDQLRAVPLENAGLIEALKKQCEALQFRSGAQVEFKLGVLPAAESVAPGAHQAILRVAQEALANIGRHARAQHVRVGLTSIQGRVELQIEDDGAGFNPDTAPRGQGLANMHERAEELGGTFEVNSRPGDGTTVTFSIPYTAADTPEEYKRKAMMSAAITIFAGVFLAVRHDPMMAVIGIIAIVWVIRYGAAWRRVRGGKK